MYLLILFPIIFRCLIINIDMPSPSSFTQHGLFKEDSPEKSRYFSRDLGTINFFLEDINNMS